MEDCIFCKIASHALPKDFILETDQLMVFPDIYPVAPVHLLIVPKKHVEEMIELGREDRELWEKVWEITRQLIKRYNLETKGYRIAINGGGAQAIDHLHFHLIGEIAKDRKI